MSIPGVGSSGSGSTESVSSQATQTIVQRLAEANAEKSAGAVNDGDENTTVGAQVNKYA